MVVGMLAVWLCAIMMRQLPLFFPRRFSGGLIARTTLTGLAPAWTLFAPQPFGADYHLFVRVRRTDDSVTEWSEPFNYPKACFRNLLWNPSLEVQCALLVVMQRLIDAVQPLSIRPLSPVVTAAPRRATCLRDAYRRDRA